MFMCDDDVDVDFAAHAENFDLREPTTTTAGPTVGVGEVGQGRVDERPELEGTKHVWGVPSMHGAARSQHSHICTVTAHGHSARSQRTVTAPDLRGGGAIRSREPAVEVSPRDEQRPERRQQEEVWRQLSGERRVEQVEVLELGEVSDAVGDAALNPH